MKIIGANITGSFILNNQDVTNTLQSSSVWSGSVAAQINSLNAASASLNSATASLNSATASLYAATASLNSATASLNTFTASAATTGSNTFNGNQIVSGSLTVTGSITTPGTLTAQTLVVQTITSSQDFVTGSTKFGSIISNTHQFTGSISVSGALAVNDSNAILTNQTSSMSVATASFVANAQTASFVTLAQTASFVTLAQTASFVTTAQTASFVTTAQTASFVANAQSASNAVNAQTASLAQTASFVTLAQTASFVTTAQTASFVTTAQTASFVANAQSASNAVNAATASFVTLAQTASFVTLAQTASFVTTAQTASFVTLAQTASFVTTAQTASFVANAQSASNAVAAQTASFANSFTVANTLTAQTLVVQTITSSVDFVTGSTRFGSLLANTHLFTGSVNITGSLTVTTTGTELQVGATGVNLGNALTDSHIISGSLTVNPGGLFVSSSGVIGIGTNNPVEGTQGTSTLSLIPSSSVAGGPLIQFASNGRIRPASNGDRLTIDGNALFLNSIFGGNIVMSTGGGNVGVGSASPNFKLDVIVTNNDTNQIVGYFGKTGGTTYGSTILRIARNAGTTTTGSFTDSPITDIEQNSAGSGPFRFGSFADTIIYNGANATGGPWGSIHFATSGSIAMTVGGGTIAGRVGIGTTNPSTILDTRLAVAENVTGSVLNSHPIATLVVNASGGGQRGLQIGAPTGGIVSPVFLKVFGTGNRFAVVNESNVENFTITSGGNVGIGVTSPYSRLTLSGSAVSWGENATIYPASNGYITIAFRLEGADSTTGTWAIGKESSSSIGANTPQYFQIVKNSLTGGALHRVDAVQSFHPTTGNAAFGFSVGIGTTNPSSALHVYRDSDVWHARFGSSSGELRIGGATSSGAVIQSYTPGGSVRDLYIQRDGGKIGIGTTSPTATKLSLGEGTGAKFMIFDRPSTGVYTGIGQDLDAGNSTDLFAHSVSNLGYLTFGKLGTNGSTYTQWAKIDPSGNFSLNGGQYQQGGVGIVQTVPIGPTATNISFSSTVNTQITIGSTSIPSSARWLLADIFITATTSDHQNFMFTRTSIGSQKSWVDTRGNNPASEFGNLTSTDIAICTYYGESDGFSSNYGIWYSSKLIPSVGRTCFMNNYGNSGSNGYVYFIVRGYSL